MSILDADDCWEIVDGTKLEPNEIAKMEDADNQDNRDNRAKVGKRQTDIRDFRKRMKKAASLITQTLDDSIV